MRLSDYKGEEALDVLADIIEPLSVIFADPEIQEVSKNKKAPPIMYVKPAIKNHKKELLAVMARLENQPVEEYEKTVNLLTLPMAVLSIINDPEIQNLFTSQGQSIWTASASSGPVTENIEAEEN